MALGCWERGAMCWFCRSSERASSSERFCGLSGSGRRCSMSCCPPSASLVKMEDSSRSSCCARNDRGVTTSPDSINGGMARSTTSSKLMSFNCSAMLLRDKEKELSRSATASTEVLSSWTEG